MSILAEELSTFSGGLALDGNKDESTRDAILSATLPGKLIIPLQQHIGEIGDILVKQGDTVHKGQMLATTHSYVSAPIHAPTSGTITRIGDHPVPHPSGMEDTCVVLQADGKDEWGDKTIIGDDYRNMSSHDLRNVIRDAGIVGLGGATFPTTIKLTEIDIKLVIINGVECEPYITCDDVLMRERADEIISGAEIICHIVQADECIIAIEDNKPDAVKAIEAALGEHKTIKTVTVPTIYPSGGERQLIKVLTGREVPQNALPADVDILCQNVGTAVAVHNSVYNGMPLISRIVTMCGDGISQAMNIDALIGTPVAHLVDLCGGYNEPVDSMIVGGPMMGFSLRHDDVPVTKGTNCFLTRARQEPDTSKADVMPCIRCGLCVDVCPAHLLPQQLYWYAGAKNFERILEHNLFDCIECGCCSYVCPSHIPLVQYFRFAKSEIWEQEQNRRVSDIARQRHEFREARLERDKLEREQRLQKKREALNKKKGRKDSDDLDDRKTSIQAALARVNAMKKAKPSPRNIDNLTAEQLEKIREIDERRSKKIQPGNRD